jgi:hypothetical protein
METNNFNSKGDSTDGKNVAPVGRNDKKSETDQYPRTMKEFQMMLDEIFGKSTYEPLPKNENPRESFGNGRKIEVTFFPKMPPKKT